MFSFTLQGISDANYKFITIEVGAWGSQSDGGTFSLSNDYQRFEENSLNIAENENIPAF